MKSYFIAAIGIVMLVSQVNADDKIELKTKKDKISYSIGVEWGKDMKQNGIDINPDVISQGIKDAFSGGKTLLTEQEIRDIMQNLQQEVIAKQQERTKQLAEKNKKEGEVFLAANRKQKDVVTLPSGLQYKIIKQGTGEVPKQNDSVVVNYRGMLINGTEFDSSYTRGQPATFPLRGLIPGFSEALRLMKVGSQWQLFIPSNLAYGERPPGPQIGPNSVLIFDLELLSIKK